jgi:hypothetical protein
MVKLADPPAGFGGVVEDCPAGDASGELEHVAEPLTDTPGGLAPRIPGLAPRPSAGM